jgi:hypothetical protein
MVEIISSCYSLLIPYFNFSLPPNPPHKRRINSTQTDRVPEEKSIRESFPPEADKSSRGKRGQEPFFILSPDLRLESGVLGLSDVNLGNLPHYPYTQKGGASRGKYRFQRNNGGFFSKTKGKLRF